MFKFIVMLVHIVVVVVTAAPVVLLLSNDHIPDLGHSKTIEVMDSICDREESESTPLLKRDYASFAV